MGAYYNARLEMIRNLTGITSPSLAECKVLRQMQTLATQLIATTEREIAGIRDGDGSWCGSDPIGGIVQEIAERMKDLERIDKLTRERATEEEREIDNFGLCPECRRLDMFDIGKEQFGVCHEHKVWWTIGQVFGADPQTDQERERNERILTEYREVQPFHYPRPDHGHCAGDNSHDLRHDFPF